MKVASIRKPESMTTAISLGFTSTVVSGTERPQCVLCLNILAMDSMKPSKLKRHLETQHPEHVGKSLEFFKRRLDEFNKQRRAFMKTSTTAASALLASYKVSYIIARCKKAHNIAETWVLPAAIDMVEIMLDEQSANKLRSIPLADNTVGRRISDISDDLCDQLTDVLKYSHFGLQIDEATDVVKDAHLITYVCYISANEIKEDLLFCKPIVGRATAVKVFNMIDNFFNEHGISWENCVGLCTDGAQSMAGRHAGLQALVREKAPHTSWTHCMLHRQALASGSMNEELGNLLKDVVRVVNYIKNSPLKGRLHSYVKILVLNTLLYCITVNHAGYPVEKYSIECMNLEMKLLHSFVKIKTKMETFSQMIISLKNLLTWLISLRNLTN
ncbi:zinc finger BED domain-containing protein 5-like [Scylla paramamosain]|uniref:zinc finger BED domain-containing protein 5-like n=1 Tax=Scylla paramamosain TaxID=85552 RepID=UPI003083B4C1